MSKLRVLFVVPSMKRAGAERQLLDLVNALPVEEFDKHVLTYRANDGLELELDGDNVRIHQLQRNGKFDMTLGRKIGAIIDEHEIEVVHCTLQNAMLYGLMGRYFAKRKPAVIVAIHTTKNADLKHELADWLFYRPLFRRCEQVWFVSSIQATSWLQKMPFLRERHRTVHNGISIAHYDPVEARADGIELRKAIGINQSDRVLCSVAGLRPEKLHSVLIDAVSCVIKDGVDCQLLLVGTGPTEPDLRRQVDRLNLQNNVYFLGATSDVRPALSASDVMMLVSAAETFSMAMLEAMAMELPVITTLVGGASEAIVDGENGYLVHPHSVTELTASIKTLVTNDQLRNSIGKKARCTVVERFALSIMVQNSAKHLLEVSTINASLIRST